MIDRSEGTELDQAFSTDLASLLANDERIPLPELSLADAGYFARRLRPAEVQRAVVLAAVAVELKVKAVLRARAVGESAKQFVEIIIENPFDVSVAVKDLFHKTMKATIGRSLSDESPELFKAIGNLIYALQSRGPLGANSRPDGR